MHLDKYLILLQGKDTHPLVRGHIACGNYVYNGFKKWLSLDTVYIEM